MCSKQFIIMSNPKVSIIVPTYNNADTINRCLESCFQQTYENIEIIVVDAFSDDETPSIVRQSNAQLVQEGCGMAAGRNIGFKMSNGEYVYHVDSDMELDPVTVEECVDYCEDRGFDALVVPEENVGDSYWAKCLWFQKELPRREKIGNARFIRSSIYERIGGHYEDITYGEDSDLHHRLLTTSDVSIGHTETIVKHHLGDMRLSDIINKNIQYAKDWAQNSSDDSIQMNQKRKSVIQQYMDNWEIFLNRPVYTPGYIIIQLFMFSIIKYYKLKHMFNILKNNISK
jgi:arabinofuranan 3-O-arabinosyltransferase